MRSKLLYGVVCTVGLLPFCVVYAVSDILYILLFYVVRYRRKVVRTNLTNAFPDYPLNKIAEIERKYYRHLCDLFAETYKMLGMSDSEMQRRCVFTNADEVHRYLNAGQSIMVVLGHYGNWEWCSSFALQMKEDADFAPLYKPIHNEAVNNLMLAIRRKFKGKPIPKQDVLRYMVNMKRENKVCLTTFIADQTPNRANLNFWMSFLNQDTPIFIGTERIAAKFNYPVFFATIDKYKRGYYHIKFTELSNSPKDMEPGELTRMHTQLLEREIIKRPELWLWSHKRWKFKREDALHGK
ncbi:MAG: lysophospholipid acyltransferase family protein [Marinifilaceae bacterium]